MKRELIAAALLLGLCLAWRAIASEALPVQPDPPFAVTHALKLGEGRYWNFGVTIDHEGKLL